MTLEMNWFKQYFWQLVVINLFNTEAKINGEEIDPKSTAHHLYSTNLELGLYGSAGQKNLTEYEVAF